MKSEKFERMLIGGHPNSLGRTVEVVDTVLADSERLSELYNCYFSEDEIVRLRTSNALKRISRVQPKWLLPYVDRLINEISKINQASTQWTLANLFETLSPYMSPEQIREAKKILRKNLESCNDWIVLNNTMNTLSIWAKDDPELKEWLFPQLNRLSSDKRKSVAGRAQKLTASLK